MIYAAQTKATDNAITFGAYNNKPLVPIRAFENLTEMRSELDKIWDGGDGDNLIRVPRSEVTGWFGKNFQVCSDGRIVAEFDTCE
jgi:hypothetical protein